MGLSWDKPFYCPVSLILNNNNDIRLWAFIRQKSQKIDLYPPLKKWPPNTWEATSLLFEASTFLLNILFKEPMRRGFPVGDDSQEVDAGSNIGDRQEERILTGSSAAF